jgi:hypothetical protein
MKRIRSLSLAAALALALLAVPSVAVAAEGGVEADSYPVTYVGEQQGPLYFAWAGSDPTQCLGVESWGEAAGPVDDLGSIFAMRCHKTGEQTEHQVEMDGCAWEFHPGSQSSIEIGPPGCGPITGIPMDMCWASIHAQTGIPATYTNETIEGVERVKVSIDTELEHSSGGLCEGLPLVVEGTWIVSGYDELGGVVDIRRGDSLNGFFIEGEESENEAEQPRFTAESFPNPLDGSLNSGEEVTFNFAGGVEIACDGADFSANLTGAATSLALSTSLADCVRADSKAEPPATVTMNSCRFSYSLSNSDFFPPLAYVGKIGVDCTDEGDYIRLSIENCEVRIGEQSPSNSSTFYRNAGSGTARYLELSPATASQMDYLYNQGFCTLLGKEHSDGVLTIGEATLRGI